MLRDEQRSISAPAATARLLPRRREPRWLPWVLAFTACALALNALIGERSFAESRRRQQQLARAADELGRLRRDNATLRERIARLEQDPHTVEAIARGELGLMRRGEILFLIKDVAPPQGPLTGAPQAR